jgi:peptidoglycan/LPS O-acetylase OafA/YrhL
MIHHGILIAAGSSTADGLARLATFGWIGVDIFFVLSGFLITGILLQTRNHEHYFRNFYARRVLRIFPLYYCFIIFILFFAPRLGLESPGQASLLRQHQAWYWAYAVNFLAALSPNLPIIGTTGHLWSLAVEEQFYCVWPAVVRLLNPRGLMQCCLALLLVAPTLRGVLYVVGAGTPWGYTMLPARVDTLAAGAIIAIASDDKATVASALRWLPRVGGVSAIVIAFVFAMTRSFGFWLYRVQLIGFSAVVGVSVALVGTLALTPEGGSGLVRCFEATWLRIFGQRSYALYVIHFPLMLSLKHYAINVGRDISSWSGRATFTTFAIVLSIVIASASWYLLENPFLRLKRLFPR